MSALWGFVLNLTIGDGLALLRASSLYDTIGVTSTDLGLQIQAERALAADMLSSGDSTSPAFTEQQRKTSASVQSFTKAANSEETASSMTAELRAPLDQLLTSLTETLPSVRDSIALGRFSRLDAIKAYNQVMDGLFAVYERLVSVPDLNIYQHASAMQAMGNAYEMLTREDALIRGALTKGQLSQAEHSAFSDWVSTRRFLYQKNRPILGEGMREPYDEVLNSPVFTRFTDLEDRIVEQVRSGGPLPTDAKLWQATVDQLTVKLDKARIDASDALQSDARSVATGIMARIAVAGGLGLVAVVATIIFSVRFGRRLVSDLAGLRETAMDLATVRLPHVVERLRRGEDVDVSAEAPPIEVSGSAEVEDVALAFSTVQRTAVEAAVGQANLRKGVNQVFLNLARRKQSLLHRQLTLLDAMQRRVSEPESLEDLFRLDHLTTRMRRHAEGLIILSGASPGRSWRKPVPIVDVVRAAVAEVEDYTRVTVTPMPNASLLGATVADIIHLLAELVENATIFSPPQTRVQVRGELVANGLVLEVEDRGLGLAPEEYTEINAKLAAPPEFDLADSDRLGLFVVGQLAARNEISVVLRSSPYGGTTAIVLVPRSLVAEGGAPAQITGTVTADKIERPAPLITGLATGPNTGPMPALAAAPDLRPAPEPRHAGPLKEPDLEPEFEPAFEPEPVEAELEPEPEFDSGPSTSPFFTPAALRTEPVPPATRTDFDDLPEVPLPPRVPADSGVPAEPPLLPRRNGLSRALGNGSAENGSAGNGATKPAGTHAGLPRRVRQASMAPQLREQAPLSAPTTEEPTEERSPEAARAMFSAFQRGAQRGREAADQQEDRSFGEKGDE
ncbi:nitrate- and nitrite sensing domain-containing protein [Streptosporangiaceae bacterium NEAU-GS5]|nr:nitrate- and nitrite sensing domain-containing protein [Streptosporangiaceae bacterium NEAU-GS5]